MEIKINREIRDYHESMFMGLSLRQTLCSLLAVGAAVGLYFWLNPILGTEAVSWACMLGAAHGMPAEKFLWVWFRSEILEPKVIRFQPTNLYYEIMKDTIAKHEKEARKQHESN